MLFEATDPQLAVGQADIVIVDDMRDPVVDEEMSVVLMPDDVVL